MITEKDYCALEYIKVFGRSNIGKKGTTISLDHRIDRIYSWYASHKTEQKTFLLSQTVAKRVEQMDISKLTAEMIMSITQSNQGSFGVILDPKGSQVRVSMTFLIDKDQILIEVFEGSFGKSSQYCVRYDNGQEDLSAFSKCFVGSVVISSLGIEKIANSPLKLLETGHNFRIETYYAQALRKILKEVEKAKNVSGKTMDEVMKENPNDYPYSRAQLIDLAHRNQVLDYALKTFLYIYCSQTIKADYISEPGQVTQRNPGAIRNYILIDSLWDMEIDVINPFKVSGHFTHQPYGEGSKLRKLIYIEPYMKKGYHRKATKDSLTL